LNLGFEIGFAWWVTSHTTNLDARSRIVVAGEKR
jgi:hypothetical protein